MKRFLQALGILALSLIITIALWFYRPWSDFSPSQIAQLTEPAQLPRNFRHMNQFFPSRPVLNGPNIRILPRDEQPLQLSYQFDNQNKTLGQFLGESTTTGLLVMKDGAIVYERYFTGANEESRLTSWSIAKSVIATAIMMAAHSGDIDSLTDPVEKYAPQFKGSGFGDVSIQHLLDMSSGVDFVENYSAEDSDIRPYFFDTFLLGRDADELLFRFQRNREPGTDFEYLSPNTHVLSAVLRGIYNQPLNEVISEKIWQPLGMEHEAFWLQNRSDEKGLALGYCCLNATLRDYSRFGLFYLEAFNGEGIGAQLLPSEWVQSLNQPPSDSHRSGGERYQGRGYSQHFWLPPEPKGEFMAAGIYGQYVFIDPNHNVVIARTSADPNWEDRQQESAHVMQLIAAQVSSEPVMNEDTMGEQPIEEESATQP